MPDETEIGPRQMSGNDLDVRGSRAQHRGHGRSADRRGSYTSVGDLETAIYDYLLQHNAKPKPFVWTKTADDILTRGRRALETLDKIRGNR